MSDLTMNKLPRWTRFKILVFVMVADLYLRLYHLLRPVRLAYWWVRYWFRGEK